MWIKYYASHVLVCREYIDESRESYMICHRSLRDELVDASMSRQDMIDMGRTHAKAGALVFHKD
jgi:predicted transcriptional regulator